MCNHDANSNDSSIILDKKKRLMITPTYTMGVCKVCKKQFKFKKVDDKYIQVIE